MSLDDGSWKKTGPDDFNGYGYFYVRLYWTGFGLPANIVEEYILLSVLLHVFVGLKRTWDMKLALVQTQGINVLNLAISGLMLLTFMTIHLFQFRFGDTDQFGPYYIRPPPYLINFWGISSLNLFWTSDASVEKVGVRDIYARALSLPCREPQAEPYIKEARLPTSLLLVFRALRSGLQGLVWRCVGQGEAIRGQARRRIVHGVSAVPKIL